MAQPVSLRIWSDFVCPWCYVGLAEVRALRSSYDLQVDWRPFLLRPETPPEGLPPPAYVLAYNADPNNPLKRRAKSLGLTMVDHGLIPSTRWAHEATEFARSQGRMDAMHAALLRRYWELGENLGSMSVLRAAALEAELDPDATAVALESGMFKGEVERALESAATMGVRAVPTFVLADRMLIQGAQPQEAFREALHRLGIEPRS